MVGPALACATCPVKDRAACSALDPYQRGELARLGRHRALEPGEVLFVAGEDNDACATLISGALKIRSLDGEGTERGLSLVHPARFAGELFAPRARFDVIALTALLSC